jgi:hypothetical protein
MTTSMIELENKVFSILRNYESVTMDFMIKKFACKRSNLKDVIKKYEKTKRNPTGLIKVSKDKNSDHPTRFNYSLEISSFQTLHESNKTHLESTLKLIELYLKNLKELKKQKPLFENVEKTENGIQSKIPRRQVKEILNNIGLILNNIYQTSFLITYYKTLNQIPEEWINQADEDQEFCMKTYSNIIKKLRVVVGRKKLHQKVLESQLFHHQMVMRRLELNPSI